MYPDVRWQQYTLFTEVEVQILVLNMTGKSSGTDSPSLLK